MTKIASVERLPSLLAPFNGERPPAPRWFGAALRQESERSTFRHDGAVIELLTWGELGKPGLLFLHGNAAHADWWSFIAPYFAADYRCAAISWSGMGKSDWRDTYSIQGFADEALAAVAIAGLDQASPPVVIAHSFGTFPLLHIAAHNPHRIKAAMLLDGLPPPADHGGKGPPALPGDREMPLYPSEAAALARFRFMPEQPSEQLAIVDFLARGSLCEVEGGWTWRFDPRIWAKLDRSQLGPDLLARAAVPVGLIHGEHSVIVTPERLADVKPDMRDCRFAVAIPDAGHHVMADQPIALIAAIRVGLAAF